VKATTRLKAISDTNAFMDVSSDAVTPGSKRLKQDIT
jgi:hypothetical protein